MKEWWNNDIEQWCYNNHELGWCIKSGFACSNIREQPLSICQAAYNNMLKHDWTKLLFYQSCSIMLTVLLQGCWANNLWYFYACMSRAVSESCVQIRFSEWKWNCQASEVVALYQILINVTCAKHCVHKRPLPLACQEFCFQNAPVSRSRSKLRTQ